MYVYVYTAAVIRSESVDSIFNENTTLIFLLTLHSVVDHKAVIASDSFALSTHKANVVSANQLMKENKS